jgi:hypothetical protein
MFRACALLHPFYRLDDKSIYNKLPLVRALVHIKPLYMIKTSPAPRSPDYVAKWSHLMNMEPSAATPRLIMIWEEMQHGAKVTLKHSKLPYYVMKSELEDLVCNDSID